jgi:hypothetical protein
MIDEIKGSFERAIELDSRHVEARWALIDLYIKLPGGGRRQKRSSILMNYELSPVDGYVNRS